jgi:branched-chain amino acid transport system ATP-binding protein
VDQLLDVVRALHTGGTTVVLVEPSPAVAARVASRAVLLDQGEVCFDGPMDVLVDRRDLLRAVFLDGGEERRPAPSPSSRPAVAADGRPVLEAHGVSVSFGAVAAVQEVDLAVAPGRIVGVVGHNGAGKTVLFDLLSGYTRPTAGRVLLDGVDVTSWSPPRRARAGLGRSFQDARLFPSTTVAETIAIAVDGGLQRAGADEAAAAGAPAGQVQARVHELAELLRLGPFANMFVAELSTGTRRIVDLACALAFEPRVLLLDEPSAGLARREAGGLASLLLDVRARTGAALVVIEHDFELVSSIGDELVALELGRVVARGSPKEVVRHPRVVESYLGSSWTRAAARR